LPKLSVNITNAYVRNLPGVTGYITDYKPPRFSETAGAVNKRKKISKSRERHNMTPLKEAGDMSQPARIQTNHNTQRGRIS